MIRRYNINLVVWLNTLLVNTPHPPLLDIKIIFQTFLLIVKSALDLAPKSWNSCYHVHTHLITHTHFIYSELNIVLWNNNHMTILSLFKESQERAWYWVSILFLVLFSRSVLPDPSHFSARVLFADLDFFYLCSKNYPSHATFSVSVINSDSKLRQRLINPDAL